MQRVVVKRKIKRGLAVGLVLSAVVVGSPAIAASSGCLAMPTLDSSHQSASLNLGSSVTAKSWTWQAGGDAESASLSPLGSKLSIVTGNLREIDFGILHWAIPQTKTLRDLSEGSDSAVGALNGDYFDGSGPWNAMIENGQVSYSPPGRTGVVGMKHIKVDAAKGYRSTGTLSVGSRTYAVTGVNQASPGPESMVVYGAKSAIAVPPKGETTVVLKAGAIYKVYPSGAAVNIKTGVVIQARGAIARRLAVLKVKTKAKLSLSRAPLYETRMAADSIRTVGNISNNSTTLTFDAVNYANLSTSGATLFDENFAGTPNRGSATLRIGLNSFGKYKVKNIYGSGASITLLTGELILQANGASAISARKFKVGDVVTISAGYQALAKSTFVSAAGRGPRLVENGKFTWNCSTHTKDFRPRSAIGWDQDGRVWLAASSRGQDAADFGFRQGGSTADQMGHWLMSLGATDVVLLDGGGSTTMEIKHPAVGWQRFDIPDSAWYRELANGFSLGLKG